VAITLGTITRSKSPKRLKKTLYLLTLKDGSARTFASLPAMAS
jgi:hypothetical protein